MPFVDTVSTQTMGAKRREIKETSPDIPSASCSALRMAMRLGTSSPKIKVKYDRMMVMSTTEIVSIVLTGIPTPRPTSQSVRRSEKLSAAKALPRNPDRVMATWMVARNRAGLLVSRARRTARLSPLAASWASLLSFMEITAISALAKIALSAIKTICRIIWPSIGCSNFYTSSCLTMYCVRIGHGHRKIRRKHKKTHPHLPQGESRHVLYSL